MFNKDYDSKLSKEMLAMTNIEIIRVDPESGAMTTVAARRSSFSQP